MTSVKRARRCKVSVWRIGTGKREAGELAMANFGRRNARLICGNQISLAEKSES